MKLNIYHLQAILTKLFIILWSTSTVINQYWNCVSKMGSKSITNSPTEIPINCDLINNRKMKKRGGNVRNLSHLNAPIIWMFVRVISDLAALFFKFVTTWIVALANKSSDKLEERDAEKVYKNLLSRIYFHFIVKIWIQIRKVATSRLIIAFFKVF